MRRQFVVVVVAVTAIIAVAFVVPLARLLDDFAQDRGVVQVLRESESLARALALVDASDPAIIESLVAVGDGEVERSIIFETGPTVGPPTANPSVVESARSGRAELIEELDGVAAYVPVVGAADAPVVRAFVGPDVLDRNVRTAWLTLFGLGVILLLLAALVADRLARSIVRPVEELADAADRFADGDLSARVVPSGPAELRTVGTVFNRLGSRLAELLRIERESVADLSHRLRTPLTALRLEVEQLEDSTDVERVRDAVDAMHREVDHLIKEARRPARTDAGSLVDLAAVVTDRTRFWEPLAADQGRSFSVTIPQEPVSVTGIRGDIEAAVDALVENVLAHTEDGVGMWIEVTADPASLIVEDAGGGFGDPSVSRRGVSASDSTGLGLDIARRTVEAGGGVMQLGRRQSGGARVEMRFGTDADHGSAPDPGPDPGLADPV